jgi:hypothetical protein
MRSSMMIDVGLDTNLNARDRRGETRLWINGELWDDYASARAVEFQEDAGGSRMTFTSRRPMERLIGRKVELYVGTQDEGLQPIFTGRLIRPMPDPPAFTSSAVALGPFAQMAEQSLGSPKNYSTAFVHAALADICSLAGYSQGTVIIKGRENNQIEELLFGESTKLLEAAQEVCSKADMVMTDTGKGNRLFLPRPNPGGGAATQIRFTADDYKTFSVEEEHPTNYASVAVLRLGDQSDDDNVPLYAVEARRDVPQPYGTLPAPKNRIWYILDFAGDQDEANQVAYDTARRLGMRGQVKWSMTDLPLAPIDRYSSVFGERVVEYTDGFYREVYDLTLHDGVAYKVAEWKMDIGGEGLLLEATKVGRSRIVVEPSASAAVL